MSGSSQTEFIVEARELVQQDVSSHIEVIAEALEIGQLDVKRYNSGFVQVIVCTRNTITKIKSV